MKKKIFLVTVLLIITLLIIGIPLLLNIPWVSKNVSWYFSGLRTPDYKMTYISLIGGIIGVWMTVGTTLLIQNIFDEREEKEKKSIVDNIVLQYLVEEIKKNHNALTTSDSSMHKMDNDKTCVLEHIKNGQYLNIKNYQREFSLESWEKYNNKMYDVDKEAYFIISKIYDCYSSVATFKVTNTNKKLHFEKSGILNYEKHYEKFKKRFRTLMIETE